MEGTEYLGYRNNKIISVICLSLNFNKRPRLFFMTLYNHAMIKCLDIIVKEHLLHVLYVNSQACMVLENISLHVAASCLNV